MNFGPGSNSRFPSRLRRSPAKKTWNQAHLAIVTQALLARPLAQRLSPELVFGAKPKLQLLEGGRGEPLPAFVASRETLDVEIKFLPQSLTFQVSILKDGFEIESRCGRRSQHVRLTLGFESVEGQKLRIPWAQIEKGLIWHKRVEMRESYFEDLKQKERLSYLLNSNAERLAPR